MSEENKQLAPETATPTQEGEVQVLKRPARNETQAEPDEGAMATLAQGDASSEEAAPSSAESPQQEEETAAPEAPKPLRRMVDVSGPPPEPQPAPVAQSAPEDTPAEPVEDFGAVFEASLAADTAGSNPQRPGFAEGDQVKGRVVHIGSDNVFVDLGAKSEGYISRAELTDDEGKLTVEMGSEVEAYVVSITAGGIHLSRGITGGGSNQSFEAFDNAFANGIPVEGRVDSKNKGGYDVMIFGERAFCPISQIDIDYTEDPSVHIGQTYRFRIIKLETSKKGVDVVVSRAELLKAEREVKAREVFEILEVGKVLEGRVRNIQPFGAFIDLGGVDGLVHVSELSWDRVGHPKEVVSPGDQVSVTVIGLEHMDRGPSKARISLSMKAAEKDPWSRVGTDFVEGGSYDGEVVRLAPYGAFIQLSRGLDGLAHISELSLSRVAHPREVVSVGDNVRVRIKDIDPIRKRIGLSLKALQDDPWNTILEDYAEGLEVQGTVENIETFGVFVNLKPGLTGLIPLSELNTEPGRDPNLDFKAGDAIDARVLSIDPNRRRLTLSRREPGQARPPRPRSDSSDRGGGRDRRPRNAGNSNRSRNNNAPTGASSGGSLGTFADLFADKLRKKK
ncbi:MAG: S1 RNA-binding domain-containing protein [Myxococcota bacterium]